MAQNDSDTRDREQIEPIGCKPWDGDLYPLHSEWATGHIGEEEREYRILKSEHGPHILIEFEDMAEPMVFELGDLLRFAHAHTKISADTDN